MELYYTGHKDITNFNPVCFKQLFNHLVTKIESHMQSLEFDNLGKINWSINIYVPAIYQHTVFEQGKQWCKNNKGSIY